MGSEDAGGLPRRVLGTAETVERISRMQPNTPASEISLLCIQLRWLMVDVDPEDLSPTELHDMIALLESARTRLRARCAKNVISLDAHRR